MVKDQPTPIASIMGIIAAVEAAAKMYWMTYLELDDGLVPYPPRRPRHPENLTGQRTYLTTSARRSGITSYKID